jgi:hypothetical protein
MRREDLQKQDFARFYNAGYYLCADHFEESQFMNATQRNSLIWNAVPSIFNIPNPPPAVTPSRQLPTKRGLLPDHKPARKRRRRKLDLYFLCCSTLIFIVYIVNGLFFPIAKSTQRFSSLTACTSKPFLGRVINVFVSQQDCY